MSHSKSVAVENQNVTVEKCHMVEVSQYKIVTVDKMLGGHMVWVGMSRGRFCVWT